VLYLADHWSSDLMLDSRRVAELIDELGLVLEQNEFHVVTTSFDYHKTFELHFRAKGHPAAAVVFRPVSLGGIGEMAHD
jgi:hypothetical protein